MPNYRHLSIAYGLLLTLQAFIFAQEPQYERMNATGKIVKMASGGLQLATENGEQWNVILPTKVSEINYSADADIDFLKPDMTVRFSATMNNKGLVMNEISSIQVFTPLEQGDLGIMPEGGGKNPAESLFGGDNKEEKKPKKGPEQVSCNVGGQIVSIKGRKMVIAAGGTSLKCELAENAKVTISVADLSYAKLGDKVQVEGRYLVSNKPAGAWANSVSVTAAQPLVNSKKKPKTTTKPDSKTESKSAAKDEK